MKTGFKQENFIDNSDLVMTITQNDKCSAVEVFLCKDDTAETLLSVIKKTGTENWFSIYTPFEDASKYEFVKGILKIKNGMFTNKLPANDPFAASLFDCMVNDTCCKCLDVFAYNKATDSYCTICSLLFSFEENCEMYIGCVLGGLEERNQFDLKETLNIPGEAYYKEISELLPDNTQK